MTKNIHEIQNSLVKYEMEQRQMNVNTFQATQKGDEEFLNKKPTN